MDTIHEVLRMSRSIDARIESRNSFVDHKIISVTGIRIGIAFQNRLRIGGGISWLDDGLSDRFYKEKKVTQGHTESSFLKFAYLNYYIDFVFHKTKRWQLSVPIQFGSGLAWFQTQNQYVFKKKDPKYFFVLYEPGITLQYKVFKWFGLGADIAYRFTAAKKIGEKLNSPTYSLKVMFWLDQLFYDLFPESKLTKKFGPAYW
jgi:hypothetical protein